MEPRQITPEHVAQKAPVESEQGHDRALSHLTEMSVGAQVEKESTAQPSTGDTANTAQAATAVAPAMPLPVPVQTDDATAGDATTPLVAADEDLIEKEWVDKAKKVIMETKDDPYRREQEVKRLQIEYVRKRYGRGIGDNGE